MLEIIKEVANHDRCRMGGCYFVRGLKILFKAEKEITKEEAKIQSAQMEIRNLSQEAQRRLRRQTTLPWLDLLFRSVTRR
jgi:hypothetical protein